MLFKCHCQRLLSTFLFLLLLNFASGEYEGYIDFLDVHYGKSEEQVMDIYKPRDEDSRESKAIFINHGGAWVSGGKQDMEFAIPFLLDSFPNYTIVNLEYRLGSVTSPAYPKQIHDIGRGIKFMKEEHGVRSFVLIGVSSGAHVSLLYAYKVDRAARDVKLVVNIVGPVDFTDSAYKYNPIYSAIGFGLVGPYTCIQNLELCAEVSPVKHITRKAPPTISFYGDNDLLIPNSQCQILTKTLDNKEIRNEFHVFSGGHLLDWKEKNKQFMKKRIVAFIKNHF